MLWLTPMTRPNWLGLIQRQGEVNSITGRRSEKIPAHTLSIDHVGMSRFRKSHRESGPSTPKRNIKTYKNPPPQTVAKGSAQDWEQMGGGHSHPPQATTYDVAVDNEAMISFEYDEYTCQARSG